MEEKVFVEEKRCTKCEEFRDYSMYYRQSDTRDGYTTRCKICTADYRRANKEKIRLRRMAREQGKKCLAQA